MPINRLLKDKRPPEEIELLNKAKLRSTKTIAMAKARGGPVLQNATMR